MIDNLSRCSPVSGHIGGGGAYMDYDPEGEYCRYDDAAEIISRRTELLREAAGRLTREADRYHDLRACFDLAARIRKELGDDAARKQGE